MSEFQWFVILNGVQLGPYSVPQLKNNISVTPDTFAWREGMESWKRIRDIPELEELFKERGEESLPIEEEAKPEGNDLALSLPLRQPPWLFWLILFLALGLYVILQTFFSSK